MSAMLPRRILAAAAAASAASVLVLLLVWVGLVTGPSADLAAIAAGVPLLALARAVPEGTGIGLLAARLAGTAAAIVLLAGAVLRLTGAALSGEPNLPAVAALALLAVWLLLTGVVGGQGIRWAATAAGVALFALVVAFVLTGTQPHRVGLDSPLLLVLVGALLTAPVCYGIWAVSVAFGIASTDA